MRVDFDSLRRAVLNKGFLFFERGDYNLNLVGIRNTLEPHANSFNDLFCAAYYLAGVPIISIFDCTTDPGTYYRENPLSVRGTAILPPGQYAGLWRIGQHQGKYEALVQQRPVAVWRDSNRDAQLDFGGEQENGLFGINCHRATAAGTSRQVDKWSAGCQVLASSQDFAVLMSLARLSATHWGNNFTYTLLEDTDL